MQRERTINTHHSQALSKSWRRCLNSGLCHQPPHVTKLKTPHGNNTDVHDSKKYGRRNSLAQEHIIHKDAVRFIAETEERFTLGS